VMEHSWEVATVAHVLALVRNRYYGGNVDVNAVVVAALYHDCSEVITGDMPSPIKYHSPEITKAYKAIEHQADRELLNLLPEDLKEDFRPMLVEDEIPTEYLGLIKSADTICAYLKCMAEVQAGNFEFSKAEEEVRKRLENLNSPEVTYFLETFAPSYGRFLVLVLPLFSGATSGSPFLSPGLGQTFSARWVYLPVSTAVPTHWQRSPPLLLWCGRAV
jgi:5'-deoxynucleotidase